MRSVAMSEQVHQGDPASTAHAMREEALGREGIHEKKEERKETLMEHREVSQPKTMPTAVTACRGWAARQQQGLVQPPSQCIWSQLVMFGQKGGCTGLRQHSARDTPCGACLTRLAHASLSAAALYIPHQVYSCRRRSGTGCAAVDHAVTRVHAPCSSLLAHWMGVGCSRARHTTRFQSAQVARLLPQVYLLCCCSSPLRGALR
jgi:hypothetical protein